MLKESGADYWSWTQLSSCPPALGAVGIEAPDQVARNVVLAHLLPNKAGSQLPWTGLTPTCESTSRHDTPTRWAFSRGSRARSGRQFPRVCKKFGGWSTIQDRDCIWVPHPWPLVFQGCGFGRNLFQPLDTHSLHSGAPLVSLNQLQATVRTSQTSSLQGSAGHFMQLRT